MIRAITSSRHDTFGLSCKSVLFIKIIFSSGICNLAPDFHNSFVLMEPKPSELPLKENQILLLYKCIKLIRRD